jgi:hypothetical protein
MWIHEGCPPDVGAGGPGFAGPREGREAEYMSS